jgi:hypothetical protein
MQIPVDFSHRVTVEELDTGKKAVFLIIRGTNEKVRIPAGQAQEIEEVLPPPAVEGLDPLMAGMPVAKMVEHQETEEEQGVSASPRGLTPGSMGGPAKPKDAFGAHEG